MWETCHAKWYFVFLGLEKWTIVSFYAVFTLLIRHFYHLLINIFSLKSTKLPLYPNPPNTHLAIPILKPIYIIHNFVSVFKNVFLIKYPIVLPICCLNNNSYSKLLILQQLWLLFGRFGSKFGCKFRFFTFFLILFCLCFLFLFLFLLLLFLLFISCY